MADIEPLPLGPLRLGSFRRPAGQGLKAAGLRMPAARILAAQTSRQGSILSGATAGHDQGPGGSDGLS